MNLSLPDPLTTPGIYSRSAARTLIHTLVEIFRPEWVVWGNPNLDSSKRRPTRQRRTATYLEPSLAIQLVGRIISTTPTV
jgi:hypothetical protein